MKMFKQLYILITLLFLTSCGFSPMLKNVDLNDIKINKIDYLGPNGLTYYLKSNINIPIYKRPGNAYSLKINIEESVNSVTKNSSGITTEEEIIITISFQVFNSKKIQIGSETVSDSKVVSITNNVSTDDEIKRIERKNIITNLSQQILFATRAIIISNKE